MVLQEKLQRDAGMVRGRYLRRNKVIPRFGVIGALVGALVGSMSVEAQDPSRVAVGAAGESAPPTDKVSYVVGRSIADSLHSTGFQFDTGVLTQSIVAGLKGEKSKFNDAETQKIMQDFNSFIGRQRQQAMAVAAEKNEKEGKEFLEKNAKAPGVQVLPSGLQYKVLKDGAGASPTAQDVVKAHYRGTLLDGTEFDSSYKRGEPTEFPVNGVIKGWQEALVLMKPGAKWELVIPPNLAYGENGAGPKIGPKSTLKFEVELVEVKAKR